MAYFHPQEIEDDRTMGSAQKRQRPRIRAMRLAYLAAAAVVVAGCASTHSASTAAPTTTGSSTTTVDRTTTKGRFEVQSLSLTFTLSPSFNAVQDASFAFLARSLNPRAVFSIDYDNSNVTNSEARPGESLSKTDLNGVHAVVVTHAAVAGLPTGIVATELRVANASRSFSVIMSSTQADLPTLWQTFIESISIQPA